MGWMRRWARRLSYLFGREREERELDDELRFHVEMETRDLIEAGVPPDEAGRRARVAFGGVDRHRERVRDARGVRWVDDLRQDVGFAFRTLLSRPGFTASVLLVLALAVGATTTIFGVVDAVLLRPLPYPGPDRLVRVWMAAPARDADRATLSVPDARDLAEGSTTLTHLAVYTRLLGDVVLTGEGPAEEIPTAWVGGDFFGVLGTPAALGRTLRPDEEEGRNRVVVVSHDYWQRRFGGDPGLVGRTLTLDHQPFEVVGVMPPDFAFPDPGVDAWVFLSTVTQDAVPWRRRYVRFLQAVGRLAPAASPATAREELSSLATALSRAHPESNELLTGATVVPLRDVMVGDVRTALQVVLGAVGMILLIACADVAGLLLARGDGRRTEIAVRMGMGAGRGRLVRQLLTESLVLGVTGGAAGVAVAWLATGFVSGGGGGVLPRAAEVAVDGRVLAFAAALTLASTVLFGLLPALRATDLALAGELREGGRSGAGGLRGARLRRILVGAEVAVAVVLLVGAGLLVRSLDALASVDPGFEVEGVAAMTLTISLEKYPTRDRYMALYREILDRVEALPGVRSVGTMRRLPTRGVGEQARFTVPGVYEPGPEEIPTADLVHVGGEVFRTLGVQVVAGRAFERGDAAAAMPTVVVNETLVAQTFQGMDPLGRTLDVQGTEAEVVGVVEDIRHMGPESEPRPAIYVYQEQDSRIAMAFLVRVGGGPPERILGELRNIVASLDPDQPVSELTTLESVVRESMARPRFLTVLLASFAGLAGLLAALGLYGVIVHTVRRRMREVGLRMALGARAADVVGLVVRQGMLPALVGLAVGLGAAALVTSLLEALLFRVRPLDPLAFAGAATLLAVVALAACAIPALRAGRLHPMDVLRSE